MKIVIVTDAWFPQVNGVVRTLAATRRALRKQGHSVLVISPTMFRTLPCPFYSEIKLAVSAPFGLSAMLDKLDFDAIHIATEGPLGWFARRWCVRNDMKFTTAWHTSFPEYVEMRLPIKASWLYPFFRYFHKPSSSVMVATPTVRRRLEQRGIGNVGTWSRGVDTKLFKSDTNDVFADLPRPVMLYAGRVAKEKNLEAFLSTKASGTKVIVGDGPDRARLQREFPDTVFTGYQHGSDLADCYASADVFVFPSKTDTFGLVVIEALACGTPVAAYPVQGPLDIIGEDGVGVKPGSTRRIGALNEDLLTAIEDALTADREDCIAYAQLYSWEEVSRQFLKNLTPCFGSAALAENRLSNV